MQVVGKPCVACDAVIVAMPEATWCVACRSPYHTACIAARDEVCTVCRRRRDPPEAHTVSSFLCTGCLRLYEAPMARCTACGTNMTFVGAAEYAERRQHMRRQVRRNLAAACALCVASGFCWLWLYAALTNPIPFKGCFLAVAMILLMVAARRFWVARRLRRFR